MILWGVRIKKAENGIRTRDLCLGKATLYQLSYSHDVSFILIYNTNSSDNVNFKNSILHFTERYGTLKIKKGFS